MVILQRRPDNEQEKTFIKHMTDHKWWQNDLNDIRKRENKLVVATSDVLKHYGERLICPRCERGAYRHKAKDKARCPHCGWEGKSVTVSEYISQKLYK